MEITIYYYITEPQSPLPKLPARKKFQKVDPTHGDDPLPPGNHIEMLSIRKIVQVWQ